MASLSSKFSSYFAPDVLLSLSGATNASILTIFASALIEGSMKYILCGATKIISSVPEFAEIIRTSPKLFAYVTVGDKAVNHTGNGAPGCPYFHKVLLGSNEHIFTTVSKCLYEETVLADAAIANIGVEAENCSKLPWWQCSAIAETNVASITGRSALEKREFSAVGSISSTVVSAAERLMFHGSRAGSISSTSELIKIDGSPNHGSFIAR
ncbi:unnamed protein product [Diplocarpon coronariae]